MESTILLLQPIIALVIWSLIMWVWMLITRVLAIRQAKMKLDPAAPAGLQMSQLPAKIRWIADNYNHLMEQPTIFYAIALSVVVIGDPATLKVNLIAAWTYVGLRILHSLIQVLGNRVELRFLVFVLSNFSLMLLTFNAARAVI